MQIANVQGCLNVCCCTNSVPTTTTTSSTTIPCPSGYTTCSAQSRDRCETNLNTDNNNCGACGLQCGSGESCQNGICRSGGATTTTTTGSSCTNTAPAAVTYASPANGATEQSTSVILDWNAISNWGVNCAGNSNKYIVFFGPSTDSMQNIASIDATGATEHFVSGLTAGQTYYWYIRTGNGAKVANALPAQSFVVSASANNDNDNDGFTNSAEIFIGTDPNDNCADSSTDAAWPPDIDNNKIIQIADISAVGGLGGTYVGHPNYLRRYDINADGKINNTDVNIVGARFGGTCS